MNNQSNTEIEEAKPVTKPAFKYGLITGVGMVIISVIYYFSDAERNWVANLIINLILLGGIIYGLKLYRNEILDGYIKYGKALGFGVMLSLFAGLVVALYSFIFQMFINPDSIQLMLTEAERTLIEMDVSDAEIDMFMSIYQKIFNPYSLFIFSVISTVFYGTIFSLITAAFLKKEKPITE